MGALANENTMAFKLARWPADTRMGEKATSRMWEACFTKRASAISRSDDSISSRQHPCAKHRRAGLSLRGFLLTVRDNDKKRGIYTKHKTSAAALGVSRRTILELDLRLRWLGVLRVLEKPTEQRNCNTIEITWPDPDKPIQSQPTAPAPPSTSVRRLDLDAPVEPTPSPGGSVRHLRFDSEDA